MEEYLRGIGGMTEDNINVIPAKVETELGLARIQTLRLNYKLSESFSPGPLQGKFNVKKISIYIGSLIKRLEP